MVSALFVHMRLCYLAVSPVPCLVLRCWPQLQRPNAEPVTKRAPQSVCCTVACLVPLSPPQDVPPLHLTRVSPSQ